MKDNRDPAILGECLLEAADEYEAEVSRIMDIFPDFDFSPDYNANPSPIEKYGDPRLIPSTMPNACE